MEGGQVGDVARQAGANAITLPSDNPSTVPAAAGGEISPTSVSDLALYPIWADGKDPPSWYATGADVDALLDVADSLDWLDDTGDLHETYQPGMELEPSVESFESARVAAELGQTALRTATNNTSVSTLPHVDSNVESVVPPLPSLFDGTTPSPSEPSQNKKLATAALVAAGLSDMHLNPSTSATAMGEGDEDPLQVFDSPMEEHDFVSTILENHESTDSLAVLGQ